MDLEKNMDDRPKIREVIVVEGKNDTKQVQLAVDALTIETRGSALDDDILDLISLAHEERGVIVLTDPDFAGEKIRKQIVREIPDVAHAFIMTEEGRPKTKRSVGVEHAHPSTIIQAIRGKYTVDDQDVPLIPKRTLRELGLMDCPGSRALREKLGKELRIGYTNGKQLQTRLKMFSIGLEEVKSALEKINDEPFS